MRILEKLGPDAPNVNLFYTKLESDSSQMLSDLNLEQALQFWRLLSGIKDETKLAELDGEKANALWERINGSESVKKFYGKLTNAEKARKVVLALLQLNQKLSTSPLTNYARFPKEIPAKALKELCLAGGLEGGMAAKVGTLVISLHGLSQDIKVEEWQKLFSVPQFPVNYLRIALSHSQLEALSKTIIQKSKPENLVHDCIQFLRGQNLEQKTIEGNVHLLAEVAEGSEDAKRLLASIKAAQEEIDTREHQKAKIRECHKSGKAITPDEVPSKALASIFGEIPPEDPLAKYISLNLLKHHGASDLDWQKIFALPYLYLFGLRYALSPQQWRGLLTATSKQTDEATLKEQLLKAINPHGLDENAKKNIKENLMHFSSGLSPEEKRIQKLLDEISSEASNWDNVIKDLPVDEPEKVAELIRRSNVKPMIFKQVVQLFGRIQSHRELVELFYDKIEKDLSHVLDALDPAKAYTLWKEIKDHECVKKFYSRLDTSEKAEAIVKEIIEPSLRARVGLQEIPQEISSEVIFAIFCKVYTNRTDEFSLESALLLNLIIHRYDSKDLSVKDWTFLFSCSPTFSPLTHRSLSRPQLEGFSKAIAEKIEVAGSRYIEELKNNFLEVMYPPDGLQDHYSKNLRQNLQDLSKLAKEGEEGAKRLSHIIEEIEHKASKTDALLEKLQNPSERLKTVMEIDLRTWSFLQACDAIKLISNDPKCLELFYIKLENDSNQMLAALNPEQTFLLWRLLSGIKDDTKLAELDGEKANALWERINSSESVKKFYYKLTTAEKAEKIVVPLLQLSQKLSKAQTDAKFPKEIPVTALKELCFSGRFDKNSSDAMGKVVINLYGHSPDIKVDEWQRLFSTQQFPVIYLRTALSHSQLGALSKVVKTKPEEAKSSCLQLLCDKTLSQSEQKAIKGNVNQLAKLAKGSKEAKHLLSIIKAVQEENKTRELQKAKIIECHKSGKAITWREVPSEALASIFWEIPQGDALAQYILLNLVKYHGDASPSEVDWQKFFALPDLFLNALRYNLSMVQWEGLLRATEAEDNEATLKEKLLKAINPQDLDADVKEIIELNLLRLTAFYDLPREPRKRLERLVNEIRREASNWDNVIRDLSVDEPQKVAEVIKQGNVKPMSFEQVVQLFGKIQSHKELVELFYDKIDKDLGHMLDALDPAKAYTLWKEIKDHECVKKFYSRLDTSEKAEAIVREILEPSLRDDVELSEIQIPQEIPTRIIYDIYLKVFKNDTEKYLETVLLLNLIIHRHDSKDLNVKDWMQLFCTCGTLALLLRDRNLSRAQLEGFSKAIAKKIELGGSFIIEELKNDFLKAMYPPEGLEDDASKNLRQNLQDLANLAKEGEEGAKQLGRIIDEIEHKASKTDALLKQLQENPSERLKTVMEIDLRTCSFDQAYRATDLLSDDPKSLELFYIKLVNDMLESLDPLQAFELHDLIKHNQEVVDKFYAHLDAKQVVPIIEDMFKGMDGRKVRDAKIPEKIPAYVLYFLYWEWPANDVHDRNVRLAIQMSLILFHKDSPDLIYKDWAILLSAREDSHNILALSELSEPQIEGYVRMLANDQEPELRKKFLELLCTPLGLSKTQQPNIDRNLDLLAKKENNPEVKRLLEVIQKIKEEASELEKFDFTALSEVRSFCERSNFDTMSYRRLVSATKAISEGPSAERDVLLLFLEKSKVRLEVILSHLESKPLLKLWKPIELCAIFHEKIYDQFLGILRHESHVEAILMDAQQYQVSTLLPHFSPSALYNFCYDYFSASESDRANKQGNLATQALDYLLKARNSVGTKEWKKLFSFLNFEYFLSNYLFKCIIRSLSNLQGFAHEVEEVKDEELKEKILKYMYPVNGRSKNVRDNILGFKGLAERGDAASKRLYDLILEVAQKREAEAALRIKKASASGQSLKPEDCPAIVAFEVFKKNPSESKLRDYILNYLVRHHHETDDLYTKEWQDLFAARPHFLWQLSIFKHKLEYYDSRALIGFAKAFSEALIGFAKAFADEALKIKVEQLVNDLAKTIKQIEQDDSEKGAAGENFKNNLELLSKLAEERPEAKTLLDLIEKAQAKNKSWFSTWS